MQPFSYSNLPELGELFGFALLCYLLLIGVGRIFKRRIGLEIGVVYRLFCIAISCYSAVLLLAPDFPFRRGLGASSIILGVIALIRPLNQYWQWQYAVKRKTPIPKFVREVIGGLLLVFTVLGVITFGYHIYIPGIFAGSSIIGIILGFAMQDTLGNVIAGFALQFGRSFKIGDWLLIDGEHVQAIEINWRSSRFRNISNTQYDVPNLHVARATVINFHSSRGQVHAIRIEVNVDHRVPPNRVKRALLNASKNANYVLTSPQPSVAIRTFGEYGMVYLVTFWINDHRFHELAVDSVRSNIWYAFHRSRTRIDLAGRWTIIPPPPLPDDFAESPELMASLEALKSQPIFSQLPEEHLKNLIRGSKSDVYSKGELIIEQGASGSSMFIILEGIAYVHVGRLIRTPNSDEGSFSLSTKVAELRKGDCFGEMSLLTGESRQASVVAFKDCLVLEITKDAFTEIVETDPNLLTQLSELLARRQIETEGILQARAESDIQAGAAIDAKEKEYRAGILKKLRSMFEL